MEALSLREAQLYRMLCEVFGKELVVPLMSVQAVCGGSVPRASSNQTLSAWARKNKCLFTVVDADDQPKLVIEFFEGFEHSVDPHEEEHQRLLKPLLEELDIAYVTISNAEFSDLLTKPEEHGFCEFMEAKVSESRAPLDEAC